jgi:site-specific recombinase XerD
MKVQALTVLFPNVPHCKMIGELTYKVVAHDYIRKDGYQALYLLCIQARKKRKIPLNILVPAAAWQADLQLVKGNTREAKDLNLIINQRRALANEIMVRYRLMGKRLSMDAFVDKFLNPSTELDFLSYMDQAIDQRKEALTPGSYRHHKATVNKLRKFRPQLPFSDINLKLLAELRSWMVRERKNNPNTIHSTLKLIKTYLNYARQMDDMQFDFNPKQIKIPNFSSQRSYLSTDELAKLERYYAAEFCPDVYKGTLQAFLFACYTGLRYSDLASITRQNIVDNRLVFVPFKTRGTGKFVALKLTGKAQQFINTSGDLFTKVPCNQVGNRNLKEIAKACGITKPVSWHVARHTFATLFLTLGGSIEVLQELMGHAKISETLVYGKIVSARKDEQMDLFDKL